MPKLVAVEAIAIAAALSKPFKFGQVVRERSENVVVKLTSSDGSVGWGEACPVPQLTAETQASIALAVERDLAPALTGEDPRDVRTLMRRAQTVCGKATFTLAAVETALLDLASTAMDVPVWRLLGGRYRTRVDLHGSVGWDEDLDAVATEAARQAGRYRALKLYVGRGSWSHDLALVDAVREAVGPSIPLLVDVNCLWGEADALKAGPRLAEAGVTMLEQPLPPENVSGMRNVCRHYAAAFGIDVSVDEGVTGLGDVVTVSRLGLGTAITLGVSKLGGPQAALDAALLAGAGGTGVVVGSVVELGIGTAAGVHLAAAVPRLAGPAYLMGHTKYREQVSAGLCIEDGQITVPDGRGLGIEVDEAAIDALRLERRP